MNEKSESLEVMKPDTGAGALNIQDVFQAVMKTDVSSEKVAVMKELLAMSAERQFAQAFVGLQSELPVIVATTIIPNRGKYEKYEDISRVVSPLLTKYAFTVSFSQDFKDNPTRIIETCHLMHGGHTRSNSFAVRCGKADTETQADCKAATTAKRNAFCNALNITIRQDVFTEENDPMSEGEKISSKQAEEIRIRVKNAGRREDKFLEWVGAKSFEEILTGRLPEIEEFLQKAERLAVSNLGKK